MNANLMTDPCIRAVLRDGDQAKLSLPGVLAALQRDEVAAFPAVMPHHSHPWHAFLCQLACLALWDKDLPGSPPGQAALPIEPEEEAWRVALHGLTPDFPNDEPWTLVVEDLSKPAFMQPPIPEGTLRKFGRCDTPDEIDILSNSKNHGIKINRLSNGVADNWIVALITAQTQAGYSIAGSKACYYSTVKQNSNYGSKPGVYFTNGFFPGTQFNRDTIIILQNAHNTYDDSFLFSTNGHKILWLIHWNGEKSLGINLLHPLFIEITTRIRLKIEFKKIYALRTGSANPRITAKEFKGNLQDPWIPINIATGASFNKKPDYKEICNILFESSIYSKPLLLKQYSSDAGKELYAKFCFFARGKNVTNGYTERVVPIPLWAVSYVFGPRNDAANVSHGMIRLAQLSLDDAFKPAFKEALRVVLHKSKNQKRAPKEWVGKLTRRLDEDIDHAFFPRLWECLAVFDESGDHSLALEPWRDFLKRLLRNNLQTALNSIPLPSSLAYKARALAEAVLEATIRKHFSTTEQP